MAPRRESMAPGTPVQNRRTSSLFPQPGSAFRSPTVRNSLQTSRRDSSFNVSEAGSSASIDTFPDAAIGDSVEVPGGWHGSVMYVGKVEGREGTFLGIDLIELDADKGRNNGTYKGVQYFSTKSATSGMFVPQGRCRVIEQPKKDRYSDLSARQLGIRPGSRMRSVSGQSVSGSPPHSRKVSNDYPNINDAAVQQKLLNDNARLAQELETLGKRHGDLQRAKAIQAQEMDELMTSVSELEAFISSQNNSSGADLELMRTHVADCEARIDQLRKEAEERRTEFRQVTEHQQATIEELKTFHAAQIVELEGKHANMEERLASSGINGESTGIEADEMERQIAEMTEMFDVLTEEQARARLDIDVANDRIEGLEKENERLLDELAEAQIALSQKPINGPRSPFSPASRRVSQIESLPDGHPQKRQTIGFLETEVSRLQDENAALQLKNTQRTIDESQPSSAEVRQLEQTIATLQERRKLERDAEIERLTKALHVEQQARERAESQQAELEATLERTILQMDSTTFNSNARKPILGVTEAGRLVEHASVPISRPGVSPEATLSTTNHAHDASQAPVDETLKCEYCGETGHDIVDCSNVFGPTTSSSSTGSRPTNNVSHTNIGSLTDHEDEDEDEQY